MIAALMVYAVAVSILLGLVAVAVERCVETYRWPRRPIWVMTLIVSLVFPGLRASFTSRDLPSPEQLSAEVSQSPSNNLAAGVTVALLVNSPQERIHPLPPSTLTASPVVSITRWTPDAVLMAAWAVSTISVAVFYVVTWLRLQRATRNLPIAKIGQVQVMVTEMLGPAVAGFARPRILVPRWLLEAPPQTRAMALSHELQHIAAHDPLLLLWALAWVALAPWNPVLWWQIKHLRFAIEADCDRRVLNSGVDSPSYAEMLLAVGQHRAGLAFGVMPMTTSSSGLEHRIRIVLAAVNRPRKRLILSGLLLAAPLLYAAAWIHAPGLGFARDIRKLPPEDARPASQWARVAARTHFPELFDRHFEGSIVLAFVFYPDGSLALANKHTFAPGAPPTGFQLEPEKRQLHLEWQDELYEGNDGKGGASIGPWLDSKNRGRLHIVYAVLKWHLDPGRSAERVQAAVKAYYPDLAEMTTVAADDSSAWQVTAYLNNDGTVNRATKFKTNRDSTNIGYEIERFTELGVSKENVGRRGSTFLPHGPHKRQVDISYAWPRGADEPVEADDPEWGAKMWQEYPPRQDVASDTAIVRHCFTKSPGELASALAPTIGNYTISLEPWVLLGHDGRLWDCGWSAPAYEIGIPAELEARYPGILVPFQEPWSSGQPRTPQGVPIEFYWIEPDSPVASRDNLDQKRRSDAQINVYFVYHGADGQPLPLTNGRPIIEQGVYLVDLGIPAMAHGRYMSPTATHLRMTATDAGKDTLEINLQTQRPLGPAAAPPLADSWASAGTIRIPFGGQGSVELFNTNSTPAARLRVILQPGRPSR